MSAHSIKICQYGVVHDQCLCGAVPVENVDCNMPDLHRPLESDTGWQQ